LNDNLVPTEYDNLVIPAAEPESSSESEISTLESQEENTINALATSININQFSDFATALANPDTELNLVVTNSFEMTGVVNIPSNKKVTLTSDTGIHTLTRDISHNGFLFTVTSTGTSLEITNLTIDGGNRDDGLITGSLISSNKTLTIGSGATLQNNNIKSGNGGAITSSGDLNISGPAKILNNKTPNYGGGIYSTGANFANITNATISGNTAGMSGGGLYYTNAKDLTITDSIIIGNTATTLVGGGIYCSAGASGSSASLTLSGTTKIGDTGVGNGNTSGNSGGGIGAGDYTDITLQEGVKVNNNTSNSGGGITMGAFSSLTTPGYFEINGNTALSSGGGLSTRTSGFSLEMNSGTINGNSAGKEGGGVMLNGNGSTLKLSGTAQINGNHGATRQGGAGGGIRLMNSTATATIDLSGSASVSNNTICTQPSDVGTGGSGGGISADNFTNITLSDYAKINGNSAKDNGGGIETAAGCTISMIGEAQVNNNVTGRTGGGIYMYNNYGTTPLEFMMSGRTQVIGNRSSQTFVGGHGGVRVGNGLADVKSIVSLSDNAKINENYTGYDINGNPTGVAGDCGGIGIGTYTDVTITDDVQINSNKANGTAGGLYVDQNSTLGISGDTEISSNAAANSGGGIYVPNNTTATISGGTIKNNTSGTDGGGIGIAYADLNKLDVASSVVFSGNSAATYSQSVAPVDLATYNAHVTKTNSTWSNSPAGGISFVRGYNNYDISYASDVEQYTVTFIAGDNGSITGTTSYPYIYKGTNWADAGIKEPNKVPANSHYNFDKWSAPFAEAINGNLEYTANFRLDSHTVIYHGMGNTAGSVTNPETYVHGTKNITAATQGTLEKTGYAFWGWSTNQSADSVNLKAGDEINIENEVHLYAVWSKIPYTVSYEAGGTNVKGLPSDSTGTYGDNYTVSNTTPSRSGYTFNGWEATSGITGSYNSGSSFTMPNSNVVLTATWKAVPEEPPVSKPPVDPPVDPPVVVNPPVDSPVVVDLPITTPVVFNPPIAALVPYRAVLEPVAAIDEPQEPIAVVDEPREPEAITETTGEAEVATAVVTGLGEKSQVKINAQTGNLIKDLIDGNVPLGNPIVRGAWSLLSLLMSIVAVVVSVLLILGALKRRRNGEDEYRLDDVAEEEYEKRRRRGRILKVLTVVLGILTPIVWLWLDNLNQPVVWVNKFTVYVGIAFVAHVVLLVVYKMRKHDDKEDREVYFGDTLAAE
jgi:uncharacterized repeat protein (TIGR02543 family)